MNIDIRGHYFLSKRFKGLGILFDADAPVTDEDRAMTFIFTFLWFGCWVSFRFTKHPGR